MTHIKSITRRACLPEKALEFSDIREFINEATQFITEVSRLMVVIDNTMKKDE